MEAGPILDESLDGYLIDEKNEIVGEAKNYDPYSRFGDVLLYEIDSFGYTKGYITKHWKLLSEQDIMSDRNLAPKLHEVRYQSWKRKNILNLTSEYDAKFKEKYDFDIFCKKIYEIKMGNGRIST